MGEFGKLISIFKVFRAFSHCVELGEEVFYLVCKKQLMNQIIHWETSQRKYLWERRNPLH